MSTDFVPERRHTTLTIGESLKIARELQGLTQSDLSRLTGIAQSAISAFESDREEPGLKRVRVLAAALGVHPAVIAFPDWSAAPTPGGTKRAARKPVAFPPRGAAAASAVHRKKRVSNVARAPESLGPRKKKAKRKAA